MLSIDVGSKSGYCSAMTYLPCADGDSAGSSRFARLADIEEIRDVIFRYCRGIDRMQLDLVRACYHPDGTDNHGEFVGGVDGFVDYLADVLLLWESTSHFVGNIAIDVDANVTGDGHANVTGDWARVETYCMAHHRRAARADRPAVDFLAAVRYIDDFERRDGYWKIRTRVCVTDWTRTDPVPDRGWVRPDYYAQPRRDATDPVFAPDLRGVSNRGGHE